MKLFVVVEMYGNSGRVKPFFVLQLQQFWQNLKNTVEHFSSTVEHFSSTFSLLSSVGKNERQFHSSQVFGLVGRLLYGGMVQAVLQVLVLVLVLSTVLSRQTTVI